MHAPAPFFRAHIITQAYTLLLSSPSRLLYENRITSDMNLDDCRNPCVSARVDPAPSLQWPCIHCVSATFP